jgi:elongation factor Ts
MSVSAQDVKELRDQTGAGLMDCKRALEEAGGDQQKARMILREKGLAKAQKKSSREAAEGIICSYVHNDRIGVLVDMACETDFVARNEEFRRLAREICLQVAGAPTPARFVSPDDVTEDVLQAERELYLRQAAERPERVRERIVEGKLGKFYEQACLLRQPYIRDDSRTVEDLINDAVAKLGENILIRRFVRMELGASD